MLSVERVQLAYNNVYLVSTGGRFLVIDTGPDYRGARETLTAALRGRRPELVVATHGHLDHAGLGAWWQAQGIPVVLGAADVPQAEGSVDADIDLMERYISEIGAPREVEHEAVAGLEQRRAWTKRMRQSSEWPEARDGRWPTGLRYAPFTPNETVAEDGDFSIAGLSVVESSGHTPGNLVVLGTAADGTGVLFSGDQLLPEITPTPAIQFHQGKRFASLPRFLDSLRALTAGGPAPGICYPGHGEPFEDVAGVIGANLAQADQRTERLAEALRAAGAATVYELAETAYPRALRRRFWQIIATVQGHLDVLAEARRASFDGERWR